MYEVISRTTEDGCAVILRKITTGQEVIVGEGLTDEEHDELFEGVVCTLWAINQMK